MSSVFKTPSDPDLQSKLGTFGDSFGVLNTLFSGLAFTGIIVSIFLQSKELKETRQEIKLQSEQFELQTNALNKQVFENTFFQLLHLHNEIIQSISIEHVDHSAFGYSSKRIVSNGRSAFKPLYMEKYGEGGFKYELELKENECPSDTNGYYMMFHEMYGSQLGHYFRNIYQILKYVDSSNIENKKFYTNLLRAQLSSYELGLLFFNCLSELGNEKFKPLLERYEFFEHLPYLDYISDEEIGMYKIDVYGKTNTELINIYKNEKLKKQETPCPELYVNEPQANSPLFNLRNE